MQIKQGIPVSPGVAINQAVVVDAHDMPVPKRMVSATAVPAQLERLDNAIKTSSGEIAEIRDQAQAAMGPELAKIFGFHLGMLEDPSLLQQFKQAIEGDRVTADYAVYSVMRKMAAMFEQQENRYFRERANDIWDLERRILGHLIGHTRDELNKLDHEAVVVAHDLTPSQTAAFDRTKIKAIITDLGGRTSHTAIMAHALGIPALVGLENVTSLVNPGDTIVVDGNKGLAILNPDAATLMEYRQAIEQIDLRQVSLDELAKLPAVTRDGLEISLNANIEFPAEVHTAIDKGANGVGLFRSEFLFLAYQAEPTEEEQYDAYKQVIEALEGRPLTIRTLDLGADKLFNAEHLLSSNEPNPFLGCRSIRLCLQNLPLFKTQLRAILRASTHGPVKIMFPLISNIMELRQAKMILTDVKEDLEDQGIAFRRDVPIGIMIEVPSAAIQAKAFAKEVDFFSIGTNDLIQYTVAADRSNERIASLYSGGHPAVLTLIKDVVRIARRAKIDVSLCGEMAGELEYVMMLIGMGLRTMSLTPPAIPEVKRLIRATTEAQCQKIARRAGSFDTDREVINYLRGEVRRILPEMFN